ncbi:SusC/RagA family TonB-dependent receptor precursor [Tenacibaculum maritimum]|uniref:SusC/RagA family TonB-linked outer membrane protein n=1 Tax=Tenacibaculum maritimum TaxID=107401 RepID=UPI0012E3FDC1|nr:SusC/RagA family TonB-linked outer membrane protein [Tenacibaculum maritimum]CAA0152155.1 SusC/RagA family TonB-dependent receptor precursor [Tenacibaculum maritimum]CAA0158569.1 SusC/RagA family TonB-dependent receptor precursor [Tenacibaculum maritimum]CAA0166717.1 SusC/RagA family TonB-dependent receptor precursor [Tenacibaculum maritimum]
MKTKFNGILTLFLALVVQISFAQEKTISGTVSDNSGPLPGVNVLIKGTSKGTETDFDGKYSIKTKSGDVLIFRFIGMKTVNKTVGNSNTINVTLEEDANVLEEVIVKGALGVERVEKSIGYAQQNLAGDELSTAVESNLANSLGGKVSGIQITNSSGSVGASTRVVLRGPTSITGNNQPLYVIDGIPLDNRNFGNASGNGGVDLPSGISDINPDDIESISVLKGPNAAALYGIRAGNGAIVITTKKGKKGQGLGINYTSSVMFQNPLVLPNYQNSYGQGSNPTYFQFVDGQNGIGDGVDESWGAPLDVGLEFVQFTSFIDGRNGEPMPWVSRPDNVKDFFNTGSVITHNVSFTGSQEDVTYRFSAGTFDQEGIVPNTDFFKRNLGGNVNWTANNKLTIGFNANYTNSYSNNVSSGGYSANNQVQQLVWSGRNVDINALRNYQNLPLAGANTGAAGTPLNWNTQYQNNPFWALDNNTNTYNRDRLIGAANLAYKISDDFSISTKVSMDQFSQREERRRAKGTNEAKNGSYTEILRNYRELNTEILASYNKDLSDDFKISLNVGGNRMYRKSNFFRGVAPALQVDKLWSLDNLAGGNTLITADDISAQKINSIYGFANFNYKDYLFLEVTGRNDWSSVLPTANNSFFYPSFNLSGVISDMADLGQTINYLKVRGGWAKVGSTGALTPYNLRPVYNIATLGSITVANIGTELWNSNLNPESTTSLELGFETRLFNNRVSLDVTYYDTKSEDLLLPGSISRGSGFNSAWNNLATMTNKGIELQLGTTAIKTEDFKLGVDINFAKNENLVTDIKGDLEAHQLNRYWGSYLRAREGQPYGTIEGRKFKRNAQGQIEINPATGLPLISKKNEILGNVQPDWTGGVRLSADYKGIKLSALFDAKIGGEVYTMTHAWGRYSGILEETINGRETGLVVPGVLEGTNTPNNLVVTAKAFNHGAFGTNVEESSVFDASYVKLREVVLSYSIPKDWIENTGINDLKFSLVGRNLAILHKNAPHIDPETGFSADNGDQGLEFGQIPSVSSYGFNMSLKF